MNAAKLIKLLVLTIFTFSNAASGQYTIDSLRHLLDKATADTTKVYLLYKLSDQYSLFDPDTSIQIARQALTLSKKIGYKRGQTRSLIRIANILNTIGDYGKSLEYHLASLKISEEINDKIGIAATYNNIALLHTAQNFTYSGNEAIKWYSQARRAFEELNDNQKVTYILMNISDVYQKMGRIDSAILYLQQACDLSSKIGNVETKGYALVQLGHLHFQWNKEIAAFLEIHQGIQMLQGNDFADLGDAYNRLASCFESIGKTDSAIYYAKRSIGWCVDFATKQKSAELLSRIYGRNKRYDSAYIYSNLAKEAESDVMKDDKDYKLKQANSYWREKIRQQEIAEKEAMEIEKRKHKLQMIFIAMFIITFFLIVLLLRKIRINSRLIEVMGVLGLLLLFEFIMIILHPYIGDLTGHTPIYMLIGLVLVSSILGPLHHNLVHWTKQRLGHRPQTGH